MGLVRPLRHVTALCGACLQSSLPRTKTVTWRNPTFASAADPHVCTQQRPGHLSSLTRVVTSQSLRVVKRHRGTIWNLLRPARGSSHPFQGDSDNFAKISLHYSVHFTPAPFKPLPPLPPPKKTSFQTPMRHGLLSHPSDSQAEWNVSRQRMSTHKRQLWFRQTLSGGEGDIKAKVKSSLGSSAPRFT